MSPIHKAFLQHRSALKRFLWRYYKRAEDVEDAAQEVFLRGFAAEARTEITHPKSFLFQTAKHYALSDLDKKSNSATDFIADCEASSVLEDRAQIREEERLHSHKKLVMLAQAVSQLPPQCRRIFLLRKFEGMRIKDIAELLGITVSAVDKQLATGLARCSDYLTAQGYGEPAGNAIVGRKTLGSDKRAVVTTLANPNKDRTNA